MRELLKPTMALLIITLAAAICLGYVREITAGPIAVQNERTEIEALKGIFGELDHTEEMGPKSGSVSKALYCYDKAGVIVGCAVFVSPKGYSGSVDLMVGFDTDGTVKGVQVLSQSETPGLGANAANPAWLAQFKDQRSELTITKNSAKENEIQAITSATITSNAVVRGVNEARAYLGGQNR